MTFSFPTQIEFGEGSVECLKELFGDLALSKVFVVTDAGLVHLKEMTNMRVLAVTDTKVTDEGVAELSKALPKCSVLNH